MFIRTKTFASNVKHAEHKRLNEQERLIPFRKAKRTVHEYTSCVSFFDGQVFDGINFYDAGHYIDSNPNKSLVVLTRTERWHLKKIALDLNSHIKVAALESDFPFLASVKYKDAVSNYNRAQYELKRLKRLGFRPARYSTQIFDKYNRKLARAAKEKSIFDNVLSDLSASSYSGVFLLADKRKNRKIYCLDFNAMFASCMLEDFCDYTKISPYPNKDILLDKDSITSLPKGFYEVSLKIPKTKFIERFHPFQLRFLSSSLGFKISRNDVIRTVLTSDEIRFHGSHFEEIYLHYGYFTRNSISHPLKPQVEHILTKKSQTSGFYRDIWKMHSTIIYSTSVVKSIDKHRFSSLTNLIKFIKSKFDVPSQISDKELLSLIQNDGNFNIEKNGGYFLVSFPCFDESKSIFSLYTEVIM